MPMSSKVERLHGAFMEANLVELNLRHRLIAAREETGRTSPLSLTLQAELQQATRAKEAALTRFSDARLDELADSHRKARPKSRRPSIAS